MDDSVDELEKAITYKEAPHRKSWLKHVFLIRSFNDIILSMTF